MACYKAFQMILVYTIFLNTASTILLKNYAAYARIIQDIQNADYLQSDNSVHPRLSELPAVLRERFQMPRRSSSERIIPIPVAPLPKFQEAPAFRNGKECAAMISSTAPYEQQQQRRQNQAEEQQLCDATSVHIAMTLDAVYLRGLVAAVQSILQHAACPENVVFHFVASSRHRELRTKLLTTFPYLRFQLYNFDEALVKHRISNSIRKALDQPLNYARIYLADILPNCVGRVIYLDSDLILVDDIAKLWTSSLGGRVLAAPEYCHANFTKYFTDLFWNDAALSSTFQGRKACYFNTGVMVIDLVLWRRGSYTAKIQEWMELQKERRIYELGSLPPFLLVFAGRVQAVHHRWNQHGLGGDNFEGRCRDLHPGPVSLLHWSGKGKPWNRLDNNTPCPLDALWSPYDLLQKHTYFEA